MYLNTMERSMGMYLHNTSCTVDVRIGTVNTSIVSVIFVVASSLRASSFESIEFFQVHSAVVGSPILDRVDKRLVSLQRMRHDV